MRTPRIAFAKLPTRRLAPALAALALVAGVVPAAGQARALGNDFRVHVRDTGYQGYAQLAATPDGGFIVAWNGDAGVGDDAIAGRRFSATGAALSGDVLLATATQVFSGFASDSEGNFVVVWSDPRSTPSGSYPDDVRARRFDALATPLGGEFVVNLAPMQQYASHTGPVAVHADGRFVVVWENDGARARQFDPDGSGAGGFALGDDLHDPVVAARPGGGFLVVASQPGGACVSPLLAKRFDVAGGSVGELIEVAPSGSCAQSAVVDTAANGTFVVAWQQGGYGDADIFARRFSAAGLPLGPGFRVNSFTSGRQSLPSLDVEPSGRFVIAWQSEGSPGGDQDLTSIQARRFNWEGVPIGAQFQVNTTAFHDQQFPAVLVHDDDRMVIAWTHSAFVPGDFDREVRARRYRLPFFADGFEDGTTSRWD